MSERLTDHLHLIEYALSSLVLIILDPSLNDEKKRKVEGRRKEGDWVEKEPASGWIEVRRDRARVDRRDRVGGSAEVNFAIYSRIWHPRNHFFATSKNIMQTKSLVLLLESISIYLTTRAIFLKLPVL